MPLLERVTRLEALLAATQDELNALRNIAMDRLNVIDSDQPPSPMASAPDNGTGLRIVSASYR